MYVALVGDELITTLNHDFILVLIFARKLNHLSNMHMKDDINGLVQDSGNSSALQTCQHFFSEMLNDFGIQHQKCLI